MKKVTVAISVWLLSMQVVMAQQINKNIAVFTPINLNEAFNSNGDFIVSGNYLPKTMLPGLDFYHGVSLAIDSLNKAGYNNLTVNIYDSKTTDQSVQTVIANNQLAETIVIIAFLTQKAELSLLADYAKKHQVYLISATLPNDGGVTNNPYLFLSNPTLKTHCKAIVKNIASKWTSNNNTVILGKNGAIEKAIKNYLVEANEVAGKPLKFRYTELTDSIIPSQLMPFLDSTKNNILIGASINESFVQQLCLAVSTLKKYKIQLVGMPTWDGVKLPVSNTANVWYTTVYNYTKQTTVEKCLAQTYKQKTAGKMSDMVLKGYEIMLKTGSILAQNNFTQTGFIEFLNQPQYQCINNSNYAAVVLGKDDKSSIDYFENNELYFFKK